MIPSRRVLSVRSANIAIVLSLSLASCARSARGTADGATSAKDSASRAGLGVGLVTPSTDTLRPQLSRIVPESARVGRNSAVTLSLQGEHFDQSSDGGNSVDIGPIHLTGVPSTSGGRRIEVTIPDRIPSQGEAPPRPLLPGSFDVSVSTARGTSNVLPFRVLP